MASIKSGGLFRQSVELKSVKKRNPEAPTTLPEPISSEQFKGGELGQSSYPDIPSAANGGHSAKEEDHFGFLYSTSEKDLH